jgi:hypothetical protein
MREARFMVLTVKSRTAPLAQQLADMRSAFGKLRRKRQWKDYVEGGVYTVEVTRNETTGLWHPHVHAIYQGKYFPQRLLRKLWHDITGDSDVVWLSPVDDPKAAADELSKYIGKPQRSEAWPNQAIRDYARSTNGTRMVGAFGCCYPCRVQDRDPMPADSPDTYTVPLSRLVTRASQGLPTPVRLALAIAERWPRFSSYIFHRAPMLEPPTDQAGKLRHLMNLIRSGDHTSASQRAPPEADHERLDAQVLKLFCIYRAEELADRYVAADYRTQAS